MDDRPKFDANLFYCTCRECPLEGYTCDEWNVHVAKKHANYRDYLWQYKCNSCTEKFLSWGHAAAHRESQEHQFTAVKHNSNDEGVRLHHFENFRHNLELYRAKPANAPNIFCQKYAKLYLDQPTARPPPAHSPAESENGSTKPETKKKKETKKKEEPKKKEEAKKKEEPVKEMRGTTPRKPPPRLLGEDYEEDQQSDKTTKKGKKITTGPPAASRQTPIRPTRAYSPQSPIFGPLPDEPEFDDNSEEYMKFLKTFETSDSPPITRSRANAKSPAPYSYSGRTTQIMPLLEEFPWGDPEKKEPKRGRTPVGRCRTPTTTSARTPVAAKRGRPPGVKNKTPARRKTGEDDDDEYVPPEAKRNRGRTPVYEELSSPSEPSCRPRRGRTPVRQQQTKTSPLRLESVLQAVAAQRAKTPVRDAQSPTRSRTPGPRGRTPLRGGDATESYGIKRSLPERPRCKSPALDGSPRRKPKLSADEILAQYGIGPSNTPDKPWSEKKTGEGEAMPSTESHSIRVVHETPVNIFDSWRPKKEEPATVGHDPEAVPPPPPSPATPRSAPAAKATTSTPLSRPETSAKRDPLLPSPASTLAEVAAKSRPAAAPVPPPKPTPQPANSPPNYALSFWGSDQPKKMEVVEPPETATAKSHSGQFSHPHDHEPHPYARSISSPNTGWSPAPFSKHPQPPPPPLSQGNPGMTPPNVLANLPADLFDRFRQIPLPSGGPPGYRGPNVNMYMGQYHHHHHQQQPYHNNQQGYYREQDYYGYQHHEMRDDGGGRRDPTRRGSGGRHH